MEVDTPHVVLLPNRTAVWLTVSVCASTRNCRLPSRPMSDPFTTKICGASEQSTSEAAMQALSAQFLGLDRKQVGGAGSGWGSGHWVCGHAVLGRRFASWPYDGPCFLGPPC
eukprot:1945900-Prymnesium_polylepis.1